MREEKEIIIHEGGTSNLLVHRTKTMIKLIIFALSFVERRVSKQQCLSQRRVGPMWQFMISFT